MTKITKILNIIYGLAAILFLLDYLTTLDIKSQTLKYFVCLIFLIGTPLIIILNAISIETIRKKIIWSILPIIIIVIIMIVGPMKFIFYSGAWRTQKILYQNEHLSFRKVEFQMQDIGALGYNKRTVEVMYLTPLFIISSVVPDDIDRRVGWIRIDKEVNELALIEP